MHIATLKLKDGLTRMANLGQVYLFSNLITMPVQWCGFWVGALGKQLSFYWIQGRNLQGDNQNFKRFVVSRRGTIKNQGGSLFFFFINQNFCHILFLFFQILHYKRDP